jgi:hypothetical protein
MAAKKKSRRGLSVGGRQALKESISVFKGFTVKEIQGLRETKEGPNVIPG